MGTQVLILPITETRTFHVNQINNYVMEVVGIAEEYYTDNK